jgi:hypothetical protein
MITNKPSILQMCLMAEVKILGLMQNPMAKNASHKSFKERLNCGIFIFAILYIGATLLRQSHHFLGRLAHVFAYRVSHILSNIYNF